jgi:hypothetical protein
MFKIKPNSKQMVLIAYDTNNQTKYLCHTRSVSCAHIFNLTKLNKSWDKKIFSQSKFRKNKKKKYKKSPSAGFYLKDSLNDDTLLAMSLGSSHIYSRFQNAVLQTSLRHLWELCILLLGRQKQHRSCYRDDFFVSWKLTMKSTVTPTLTVKSRCVTISFILPFACLPQANDK